MTQAYIPPPINPNDQQERLVRQLVKEIRHRLLGWTLAPHVASSFRAAIEHEIKMVTMPDGGGPFDAAVDRVIARVDKGLEGQEAIEKAEVMGTRDEQALDWLHRASVRLGESFQMDWPRSWAQGNMDARALIFNASNGILMSHGIGISRAEVEGAAILDKVDSRLFGPCDPQGPAGPEAFNHKDCAYFNDLSGETCSCDCHTPSDIKFKLQRLKECGIILSPELEERLRP